MSYGMGWVIQDHFGHRLLQHAGAIDGFRCHFTLVPKARLGIVLLCNLHQTRMNIALSNSLLDMLLGLPKRDWNTIVSKAEDKDEAEAARKEQEKRKRRHTDTKLSRELAGYTGTYQHPAYGTVRVALLQPQLTVAWSGGGRGDFWIGGRPIDLRAAASRGDVVQARLRIERPPASTVRVGVRCAPTSQAAETGCGVVGGAMLDATQVLTSARRGGWATLSIPLVCFAGRATGLSSVAGPFALRTEGELALSFTDIRLVHAAVRQCHLEVEPK